MSDESVCLMVCSGVWFLFVLCKCSSYDCPFTAPSPESLGNSFKLLENYFGFGFVYIAIKL